MKILVTLIVAVLLIVIVALIGMFFFWAGWNIFVSPAFAMPTITLWQAFCAMLIIGVVGSAFKQSIKTEE